MDVNLDTSHNQCLTILSSEESFVIIQPVVYFIMNPLGSSIGPYSSDACFRELNHMGVLWQKTDLGNHTWIVTLYFGQTGTQLNIYVIIMHQVIKANCMSYRQNKKNIWSLFCSSVSCLNKHLEQNHSSIYWKQKNDIKSCCFSKFTQRQRWFV